MVVVTENQRNKRSKTMIITQGFLPYDVLMEIFLRLPTRTLVRFSCVAKSWNFIVFSNELSKKHLQYSKRHSNSQYRIMLASDRGGMLEHFSLHSALNKPSVPVFQTNHVDKFPIGTRMFDVDPNGQLNEWHPFNTLIGSCNGLICIAMGLQAFISGNDTIYLWNPSIQKSKKIPSFGEERGYRCVRSYGFGFDESRDDYKIVAFYFSRTDEFDVLVKIFSLKTGQVKRIKNHMGRWLANHLDHYSNHTTFANGKIHWFAKRTGTDHGYIIAYLDLATEEYGEIKKHDFVEFTIGGSDSMMALPGGSLYVCCYSSCLNCNVDIIAWLVEPSYAFGEASWTQVIVSRFVYFPLNFGHRDPLFMLDNGVKVWLCGKNVIIFNPNDSSVRSSQLTRHHQPLVGISYIESLVSPCDEAAD